MKRFWIAVLTLACLFLLSAMSNVYLQDRAEELTVRLEKVVRCAEQEAFLAAKEEAIAAKEAYDKAEPLLMLCIKTDVLEEIEAQFLILPVYADHKDGTHLTAEAKKAIALIDHLRDTEKPTFVNVFCIPFPGKSRI